MKKDFLRHSFLYSISGILLRGIGIFLVPLYTRVFNPDDYGLIDWLATIGALFGAVLPMQITQAVARFYPDAETAEAKKKIASTALWFALVMRALPLVAFLLATDYFADLILAEKASPDLLILWGVSIVIVSFTEANANLLKWTLQPEKRVKVSLASSIGGVLGVIIFVLGFGWGLEGIFLGRILGGIPGMIMGGYACREFYIFQFDFAKFKEMLRFSFPLIFTAISVLIMSYADRVFIKSYLSFDELGLYGVGYRFSSISSLFFTGIAHALTPLIYHHYKEKETPKKIADLFRYTILVGGIMVLGFTFFSKETILILATEDYLGGAKYIPYLVAANIISLVYVFFPGMEINKRTDLVTYVFIFSAMANVGLNYIFIQMYGAVGVALGTLLASVLNMLIRYFMSQRFYRVPFNWPVVIGWSIFCVAMVLVFQHFLIDLEGVVGILIKAGLLLLIPVMVLLTGLLKKSEIAAVRKLVLKK